MVAIALTVFMLLYKEFTGRGIDDMAGQALADFVCKHNLSANCSSEHLEAARKARAALEQKRRQSEENYRAVESEAARARLAEEVAAQVRAEETAKRRLLEVAEAKRRAAELEAKIRAEEQESRRLREEAALREQSVAKERARTLAAERAQTITFEVRNRTGSTVHLEFTSNGGNHAWPGNGKVWVLEAGRTLTEGLRCNYTGEEICYGAWYANNPSGGHWGAGHGGRQSCSNCCYACNGGTARLNLDH